MVESSLLTFTFKELKTFIPIKSEGTAQAKKCNLSVLLVYHQKKICTINQNVICQVLNIVIKYKGVV